MKMTMTFLTLVVIVTGFALVGDALAQPTNPSPAASDTSGGDSAADEAKPEEAKPDEAKPTESEPSEPAAGTTEEGKKEEGKVEAPEKATDQASSLFASIKGGQWLLAFGFFAMLLGSILRYAMKLKWKFWDSKTGGYVIAGVTGLAALGVSVVTTGSFSMDGVMAAATIMLTAMGLHGPAKAAKEKVKPSPA